MSQTSKTTARFDALRLTYLTPQDARADFAEWTAEEFANTMYEPLFSVEDHSFSHAFGTEQVEHVECHDCLYSNARIVYTVLNCPTRTDIPTPPREIESRVTWHNKEDDCNIPSLPDTIEVWCHMELTAYEVRCIGPAVQIAAAYSYQYSFEPVLACNLNAEAR